MKIAQQIDLVEQNDLRFLGILISRIDYAKIVAEVEDIVHEPKASALCLQLRLLFSIVNAKHNIIVIIIPTVYI